MKNEAPKIFDIIQWVLFGFFALITVGLGFNAFAFIMLIATVLILPIKPVKGLWAKLFRDKAKVFKPLILFVAFIVAISGFGSTLPENTEENLSTTIVSQYESSSPSESNTPNDSSTLLESSTTPESSAPPKSSTAPESSAPPISTAPPKPSTPSAPIIANPSAIPEYSGKAFVTINNNVPVFSSSELSESGYEKYSNLDSFGRVQMCIASVGLDTMPGENEERGSISSITPTGWKQAKYDCISGGWLYNRCHLIGWQLSAENANKKNLITGTKYLNVNGMLPFENMVADYIKETGNHCAYRITPIYEGNNLLASGVQMEAYSVEDNGDGICFNVYCFNVQPNVIIDYSTGVSSISDTAITETNITNTTNNSTESNTITYILSKNTKKFHREDCGSVNNIKPENKGSFTGNREDIISQGYSPCGNCKP